MEILNIFLIIIKVFVFLLIVPTGLTFAHAMYVIDDRKMRMRWFSYFIFFTIFALFVYWTVKPYSKYVIKYSCEVGDSNGIVSEFRRGLSKLQERRGRAVGRHATFLNSGEKAEDVERKEDSGSSNIS